MKVSRTFLAAAAAALVAAPGSPSRAEEPDAKTKAMMEKYAKAAAPGPDHKELEKLAGKWNLAVTFWQAPGAPPEKSEATSEHKMILGGRYLKQEVRGTMWGQPFEGLGIEGFDNITRERVSIWIDSSSTATMIVKAKCPTGAKKCTYKGRVSDAIAGKEVPVTETLTMVDDNHMTFEMFGPGPKGKVFKMMEIAYTRQ